MFDSLDTTIILIAKLVLLIGFIYALKYWYDKKKSIIPVILYWVLGLFFVLLISSTIFDWLIISAMNTEEYGALSVIFAIVFYVYVGLNKFRNKN
ncbi:hypothetical protein [Algibacter pectinivorans]|uniref:Uncharacterized protein n=1 Tax=Algibacter pectinivorans TaxID=870482 RepID=A0A1I1S9Z7_9FLAO|nr:hypothetical protein [Algibacter pectinivorans]SFD43315.1 hypothetical protein SAMN04487987_1174 [Algibacter pectinivorans]